MESSPTEKKKSAGPLIAAGLLLLVGLASIATQYFHHRLTPKIADWQRAAQAAVELAMPEDAIRVHPSWTEEPLPHLLPVGNLLHRQHHPILEDFTGLDRVLILAEARRTQEALDRLPFRADMVETQDFGTVSLLVVPVPKEFQIPSDLAGALSQAKVFIESGEGIRITRCTQRGGSASFRCPSQTKSGTVQATFLEIEHDGRRCIQAFPPAAQGTLIIELPLEHPLDILRVRAGLDQRAARLEKGDDVIYRIIFDDELIAELQVPGTQSTWQAHDIPTSEQNGPSTLRLEVQSVDPEPYHRRFCFNAWALTDVQAAQSSKR